MAVRWERKRPNEVRDYRHDWTVWLDGDTIATSTVTVAGVTKDSDTNDTTSITVWLSGGTAETLATVTNTITTAGGRTETETFTLPISLFDEPVSLAQAKAQCRVTDTSEDALICSYIKAAREWVENHTGHILVRREITEYRNSFTRFIELRHRPVVLPVTEIGYTDSNGTAATFADFIATARSPVRVYPALNSWWPTLGTNGEVSVTYTAGYAPGEEPQPLIQAMLMLISHWHASRSTVTMDAANEVPFAVEALCNQYRVPGL
jgi:uncharacterized phiE125 gp8 family phage protein